MQKQEALFICKPLDLKEKTMNLHIEITQEQYGALIELLNAVEALCGHEAAVPVRKTIR